MLIALFTSLMLINALGLGGRAQSKPPEQVPRQTGVSNLALLGSARSRELPASHRPFRPGERLRLGYPLERIAKEVQPYGWRYSSQSNRWRMHVGHDLIAPAETPVLAMLSGQVLLAKPVSGYGLTILLDHGRGWQTLYAHLKTADVKPGQLVRTGEPIGRVGRSGSASTDHLHVELRKMQGPQTYALDLGPLLP